MFDPLSKEAIFKIIDIELSGFNKRVKELGYTLNISNEARDFIAEKGYDAQFGARPLKRAIQKYLEDKLAELIIEAELHSGDEIRVTYKPGDDELTTEIIKGCSTHPELPEADTVGNTDSPVTSEDNK